MGNLPPRLGAFRVAGLTPLQQYPARRLLARSGVDEVPDASAVGDLVLVALERLPLEGARGVVTFSRYRRSWSSAVGAVVVARFLPESKPERGYLLRGARLPFASVALG